MNAAEHPRRWALHLAERGWPVFPITPWAKRPPLSKQWETHASTDPDRIRSWWRRTPYTVGIAVGPAGLVVIDLDTLKPGDPIPDRWAVLGVHSGAEVLHVLAHQHHTTVTPTYTVRTPSGGWHLYYTTPPATHLRNTSGSSRRGLGWLIDTRAHGGYAIAPGSPVPPNGYQLYDDRNPAPLPDWITRLLNPGPPAQPPAECSPSVTGIRRPTAYAQRALDDEVRRVLHSPERGHNWALNKAAYNLGRHISAGTIHRDVVEQALQAAGETAHTKDTPDQIAAVIQAGITAGIHKHHGNTP